MLNGMYLEPSVPGGIVVSPDAAHLDDVAHPGIERLRQRGGRDHSAMKFAHTPP
jgi:hypothetical protein